MDGSYTPLTPEMREILLSATVKHEANERRRQIRRELRPYIAEILSAEHPSGEDLRVRITPESYIR